MISRALTIAFSGAVAMSLLLATPESAIAAKNKASKKPVIKLRASKFLPEAREVELFKAMDAGEIETRVVAHDSFNATAMIENKTDQPLNIKFPKAVITAPVMAQFGMGGGGGGGMGGGAAGRGGGGGAQMGGGGMGGMGGGMGGMGGGMGGMGGGGGGMFSVPPEKIVAVHLNTVCLEHGKEDPNSSIKYKLVPVELVTKDPLMPELLAMVASKKFDKQSIQAAAWHYANRMSWQELAAKYREQLGGLPPVSYFETQQLYDAQQILVLAEERLAAQPKQKDEPETPSTDEQKPVNPRTTRLSEATK